MQLYLIRNTINGKGYIGITRQNLSKRWSKHVTVAAKGEGFALARAIRKYGVEHFTITVLAEASTYDELRQLEKEAIATHDTFGATGHGYNLTTGGEGSPGVIRSAELRKRMSEARLKSGFRLSEAAVKRMVETKKQNPPIFSQARRAAISQRMRSMPRTPEHCQRISEGLRGRIFSEETRQKIAAAKRGKVPWNKGRPITEEARRKNSEAHKGKTPANKGRPITEEHRVKAYAAMLKGLEKTRKPILFNDVVYCSIADAGRETGLGIDRIRYALRKGRASYMRSEDIP